MEVLTLNGKGLAVAAAMGLMFAFFGWKLWWFFFTGMILFLVLSAAVTWIGRDYKTKKSFGQDPRGVSNVLANGSVPLVLAGLYRLFVNLHMQRLAVLCLFGFIAAVAAITADKFASEIGVLDGMPVSLLSGKKVRKGVSGGITWLGLTVSAVAPLMIALILVPISMPYGFLVLPYLSIVVLVLSGFVGSLVDSVLGYYEEKGIGNKFTSNLACSAAGAVIGIAIISII
ncbi:MAG: DUF92 domain-containing protein [Candidatus Micrarchaeota archaeon]|nr:DUF92 domain-containing protein [Candidatus Micrarchaeota archaeon]